MPDHPRHMPLARHIFRQHDVTGFNPDDGAIPDLDFGRT